MHGSASGTSAFTATTDKPEVLDLRASPHMTRIKENSLSFLDNISHVNIVDGTSSTVHEKRVVHTSSLSLNDVLFVSKFSVSLSINKLTTQNH